jgi:hypothetical protein
MTKCGPDPVLVDTATLEVARWPAGSAAQQGRLAAWGGRLRRIDVPTPTGGCVRSMAGVGRLGG